MRVALVSPYDPFPPGRDAHVGGVERVFGEFAARLQKMGEDVTVVCSSEDPAVVGVEPPGVEVVRVPRRGTMMRTPLASLAPHVPDADVVHVPATYPFTTSPVLRRAQRQGVPCILDFHFEPDPVTRVGRAAAVTYRMLGPQAYPSADAVLVRSMSYGRSAPSLAKVPEGRWRELPNGIDPQHFRPDGPRAGGDYLLFVGRLVPYKGLDVLLQALHRMHAPPPLVVAGDGPLRATLEREAERLGVDATFIGAVEDEELPRLYRGALATLLPSVGRQECFGITLLESMACGTPVIASALPGVEDVARRGGLVFTPGDPDSLARTLSDALAHDVLPRGRRLARAIHQEYSWDAIAHRLHGIYRETVGPVRG